MIGRIALFVSIIGWAFCAANPEWTVFGLAANTACIVGLASGRLLGALVDGDDARITLAYLAIEAGSAAASAAALWSESRPGRSHQHAHASNPR